MVAPAPDDRFARITRELAAIKQSLAFNLAAIATLVVKAFT
jgi:hypothetical protein